jgi:putative phosphotransacetylase
MDRKAIEAIVERVIEKSPPLKYIPKPIPIRKKSQVEIAVSDAYILNLFPPVRDSGDLDGTPGITVIGNKGACNLKEGLIHVWRHIHMSPKDASEFGISDGDRVKVVCGDDRRIIFDEVIVRVDENFSLEFHIDTDEAGACGVKTGDIAYTLKPGNLVETPKKAIKIEKKLITEEDVKKAVKDGNRILVTKRTIITPLALDLARAKNILEFS